MTAAMKSGALKISKSRLVVWKTRDDETQDEDEEGFALSFGFDTHRVPLQAQSWRSRILVLSLVSCRLGSLVGFRWRF